MIVHHFSLGPLQTNAYLVVEESSHQALAIDPGGDPQPLIDRLRADDLTLVAIINTHGHPDHIAGNAPLQKATGAKLLIHPAEAKRVTDPPGDALGLGLSPEPCRPDILLQEGDQIQLTNQGLQVVHRGESPANPALLSLTVMETPGHSPGSISLLGENCVFSGDCLFAGGVGRTDLGGGSTEELMDSLHTKILTLEDSFIVYPGHGPETTIGEERANNPWAV